MAASVATEQPTAVVGGRGTEPVELAPAQLLAGLHEGVSKEKVKWGKVSVSNEAGHARSHIHLESKWDVPPEALFAVFTYPDNSAIFRDVKKVGQRRVVQSAPGFKVVEAEQLQHLKVLWIQREYSTWLKVTEDSRNPERLTINFDLIKSDVLAQFAGRWEITPINDDAENTQQRKVVGCHAMLDQQVLPKGIPPFMQNLPVMGNLLRGVAMRAIRRVVDDLAVAMEKIKKGLDAGRSVQDMLRELCGMCEEEGHANGAVKSFAIQDGAADTEEEEEQPQQEVAHPDQGQSQDQDQGQQVTADDGDSVPAAPVAVAATAAAGHAVPGAAPTPQQQAGTQQPGALVEVVAKEVEEVAARGVDPQKQVVGSVAAAVEVKGEAPKEAKAAPAGGPLPVAGKSVA